MEKQMIAPTKQDDLDNMHFEKLMKAMANPGLEVAFDDVSVEAIAQTLLDRETRVFCGRGFDFAPIAAMGGLSYSLPLANYVFMSLRDESDVKEVENICVGDLLYPEKGATVFAPANFGSGRALRLSGPGIKGNRDILLNGVDDSFWPTRQRMIKYPLGFDVLFLGETSIVGLARSTFVTIL